MYRADQYDIADLSAFWIRYASEMYERRGEEVAPWVREHYDPSNLKARLQAGAMMLAQREGCRVVGAIYIKPGSYWIIPGQEVAEAAHFGGLYLEPHLRNRGLGREMLLACLRWADQRRSAVSCSILAENDRMLAMAALNGFEITCTVPDKTLIDVQWNICVRPALEGQA